MAADDIVLKVLAIALLVLHCYSISAHHYPSQYSHSVYRPHFDDDYPIFTRPYAPPPYYAPPRNPFWDQILEVFSYDAPFLQGKPYGSESSRPPYGSPSDHRPYAPQPNNKPYGIQPDNMPYRPQPDNKPYGPQPDNKPYGLEPDNKPHAPQPDTRPYGPHSDNRPYAPPSDSRPYGPQSGNGPYEPSYTFDVRHHYPQQQPDYFAPPITPEAAGHNGLAEREEAYNRYKDYFFGRYGTNFAD